MDASVLHGGYKAAWDYAHAATGRKGPRTARVQCSILPSLWPCYRMHRRGL